MVDCGEVIFGAEIAHGAELGLLRGGRALFLCVLRAAPAVCKVAVL